MSYEPVIGLEVHAELATVTKMFCGCRVVDATTAAPNTSVCPVCAGMPGTLPVLNRKAVEYGVRVALALGCEIRTTSIFARKNYFYPDLPKGYQISQYEDPLAVNGLLVVDSRENERFIRIRRVHLEEDTGKLTHVKENGEEYSLVDLNRAGVPLLEIVSEPDMHSLEDVRAYATALRAILRELGVNSGDMEKGVIRFEANVSVRRQGETDLGTRVEIKNLNSFRAMERAVAYELTRQSALLDQGGSVSQETLGWDEQQQRTRPQRSKEEAHDYRYFPEPDLPPLTIDQDWVEQLRAGLPELPWAKSIRFQQVHGISASEAVLLAADREVADFYESCVRLTASVPARSLVPWITGEIFAWMNQSGLDFDSIKVTPEKFIELLEFLHKGQINQNTAKAVLVGMLESGKTAKEIILDQNLGQVSDTGVIEALVSEVLINHPKELVAYLGGKETLANWFFGQVMRAAGGKANPTVLKAELEKQLFRKKLPPHH
jgi:aspartyl-tRNA(Asn)/glutamyl-tRNA(Gln) amidotransferase subunit B